MCGIVGAYLQQDACLPILVAGLRVLEYRGYDSVGVGVLQGREVVVRKRAGRIEELEKLLGQGDLSDASIGIGHSRWATHGAPTDDNAHPHTDVAGRVAVVHNGIIENYLEMRRELEEKGVVLSSQTDTEVIAHLIAEELDSGVALDQAVHRALGRLQGYYALAVLIGGDRPQLVCARKGPPICLTATEQGAFLASDALALLPHGREIVFLEDGDVAVLAPASITVRDADGRVVERPARRIDWDAQASDKGGWPHYMLKEIHEQADVVGRCSKGRVNLARGAVELGGRGFTDHELQKISRVQFLACGTALHAALVGRYMLEGLAGIAADVDFASEFRYRQPVLSPQTLAVGVSQSGETADTLAALRLAKELGCSQLAICNSIGSSMVREADSSIPIEAGPEIGVASTKAFIGMLVAMYLFAIRAGRARGVLSEKAARERLEELHKVRPYVERLCGEDMSARVEALARRHVEAKGFLFIGRGVNYPIALEGALKLKEISYKHAEGYPAGEMKHGPIAMIEPEMTTVVLASNDAVASKVRQNIEQVRARGGPVICVGSDTESRAVADEAVEVPEVGPWLSPLLNVIPLQLFSYFIARELGCDIDKPRNLAKSVTVE
jgi:glucosamine--fructose-6-phosphate aminotransferase (isomerizing)